jgi:hypothetical protein
MFWDSWIHIEVLYSNAFAKFRGIAGIFISVISAIGRREFINTICNFREYFAGGRKCKSTDSWSCGDVPLDRMKVALSDGLLRMVIHSWDFECTFFDLQLKFFQDLVFADTV